MLFQLIIILLNIDLLNRNKRIIMAVLGYQWNLF